MSRHTIKLFSVIVLILTLYHLPTFYGFLNSPPGEVYLGQVSWMDPYDINVYAAAIRWSQEFGFDFQNAYTTIPHKPIVLFPLYTFLGIVFKKADPFLLFQISTTVAGVILLTTIYKISHFFVGRKYLLTSLFLICLGGGFGWLGHLNNIRLPDLYTTPFTFYSSFLKAHEALAVSAYITALGFLYLFYTKKKTKYLLATVFFENITVIFYPFYILSFYVILVLYSTSHARVESKTKLLTNLLVFFLLTFPLAAANSWRIASSVGYEGVVSQYFIPNDITAIILGYGFLFPLILFQLTRIKKWASPQGFLAIWFFSGLFLSFVPLGFQKLYLRGLFFPAVLLALSSLADLPKFIPKNYLIRFLILFVPITTLIIITVQVFFSLSLIKKNQGWEYFMSNEEYEGISYLKNSLPKKTGVITNSYFLGNLIPAETLNRVYLGHELQTPDFKVKLLKSENFFLNLMSDSEAKFFLEAEKIEYVVRSSREVEEINDDIYLNYTFLEKIFENRQMIIYRVMAD